MRLLPEAAAQTAELTRDIEGRHTTTTARWYRWGSDSAIIDAPGVRDFAPPASLVRAAERGFVEIHRLSVNCRFKDCRHMEEPGCAVRTASSTQQIAPRRYESYRRLFRLYEKLAPDAPQETVVRPAKACAKVPPSTYSSSPPTGTPWAMREAFSPKRSASSPR